MYSNSNVSPITRIVVSYSRCSSGTGIDNKYAYTRKRGGEGGREKESSQRDRAKGSNFVKNLHVGRDKYPLAL